MNWMRRLIRKDESLVLAGALVLIGIAAGFYVWSRPSALTVAVVPRDAGETRLVEAYAAALKQARKDVSLRLVPFDTVRESAEALASGKTDLAIVRPDVVLPGNGMSMAVLRQEAVIVLAPEAAKIDTLTALAAKRLGVVARHEADPATLAGLLEQYGLRPPEVTLVPVAEEEVEAAFAQKRIDAVALIAAPFGAGTDRIVRAAEKGAGRKIALVPIEDGEAVTQRNPNLTTLSIPPGAFGGRPKLPAEEVKTVGVTYRLMARAETDRDRVARATEYLFEMRGRLARETPAAYRLEAPDFSDARTATSATLPIHPGAIDYFQREQQTFFTRYGDWIYLVMFSAGGVFSGIAWLTQRFARKRREVVDRVLDRLIDILGEARAATSATELDRLSLEVDSLVVHAVRYARHHATGTRAMSALILALDSSRAAIADCRRKVTGSDPATAPPTRGARLVDLSSL